VSRNKARESFREARPRSGAESGEWIFGRRPVFEVLRAGARPVFEALLPQASGGKSELASICGLVAQRGISVRCAAREELDEICCGGNHQGVALRTGAFPYVPFESIVAAVRDDPNALVILLDHIEDPQNAGSILRSANAVGAAGIVIPSDRSTGITPSAVRASAGASEYMRVAKVVNLARSMAELKDAGMWITALDIGEQSRAYTAIDFRGRVGLVVGSEGAGVSRLVRERSDFVASLPMCGRIDSLNAGVAAAVVMYEVLRQRNGS
jgi:23S rRNA (guanosine2251-2'-O)-methyltransferase